MKRGGEDDSGSPQQPRTSRGDGTRQSTRRWLARGSAWLLIPIGAGMFLAACASATAAYPTPSATSEPVPNSEVAPAPAPVDREAPTIAAASVAVDSPTEVVSIPAESAVPEADVRLGIETETPDIADSTTIRRLMDSLTRNGMGPYEIGIEAVYGHPALLKALGQTDLGTEAVVFFISESIHESLILTPPPTTRLAIDGGTPLEPMTSELTLDDFHHRTSRHIFQLKPDLIAALNGGEEHVLKLIATIDDGYSLSESTYVWRLPLNLPNIAGYTD